MTQDQDPEQIRDGIEQTQRELSANVDALTTKLSPQRVVHDKVQRARTAVGSVKERASATAAQKSTGAGRRGIEISPAAAGLVVLGTSWLIAWLIWPSRRGSARPGDRGR